MSDTPRTDKYILKGRYGQSATLRQTSKNRWMLRVNSGWCRYGMTEDCQSLEFVDPEGGPFIQVGYRLSAIQRDLPSVAITKIELDKQDKIILHTKPR
jgi:hypothetical protein